MAVPANVVDKLIEQVKLNLGRTGDATLDDYVIEWINRAQQLICTRANFWFMRATETITVAQSTTSIDLTAETTRWKKEDSVWIERSDGWTRLESMEWEDFRKLYDNSTEDEPEAWVIDGALAMHLRPIPDEEYDLRVDYWQFLAALVSGGSTNMLLDNYPDALESGATYLGYRYLSEYDDAREWKGLFDMNIQSMLADNADRVLPDEMVMKVRVDAKGNTLRRGRNR